MTFNTNELRNVLIEKYNVSFTRQKHENSQWSSDSYSRIVREPKDYKEDEWLYIALHEIGHIEKNHRYTTDPYEQLRQEAEAWRWANMIAREIGYEVPRDVVLEYFGSFVEQYADVMRKERDRFGKKSWWVVARQAKEEMMA